MAQAWRAGHPRTRRPPPPLRRPLLHGQGGRAVRRRRGVRGTRVEYDEEPDLDEYDRATVLAPALKTGIEGRAFRSALQMLETSSASVQTTTCEQCRVRGDRD